MYTNIRELDPTQSEDRLNFVFLKKLFYHFRVAQSEQFWRRNNKSGKDEESSRYYLEYQNLERERMATQTQRPDSGSLFRYIFKYFTMAEMTPI